MSWQHYPEQTPFGKNVDICSHGNVREHGSTERICILCDWPEDAKIDNRICVKCDAGTWHEDGKCLRCGTENSVMFL